MKWTLLYMFVFLKIPIALLGWIVWWAIHNVDEPPAQSGHDDDGGIGKKGGRVDHPRGPKPPRPARRGPHTGEPPVPAPARSRRTAPERKRTTR